MPLAPVVHLYSSFQHELVQLHNNAVAANIYDSHIGSREKSYNVYSGALYHEFSSRNGWDFFAFDAYKTQAPDVKNIVFHDKIFPVHVF